MTDANELEYRERLQRALGPDFTLGDLIGRGGFGSVYAAVDRKLDREVAVKALRHDLFPTPLVLERFEREAKAVAKLRHANILPVYAVGAGEGLAYMIMPVIRGSNLKGLLSGGQRVDPATTVRIISEVARALEAAHRLGVVHRDVKPENILLEGDDQHALLSDFGIAKSANEDGALTASGMFLGSPPYMSPEQASADRTLDGRSDIYSLGTVAYEMLAGRRPYDATSFQQMLVLQVTTEPKSLREVAPDIPGALADTIMRALERDRALRWPSAGEFAAALARSVPHAAARRRSQAGSRAAGSSSPCSTSWDSGRRSSSGRWRRWRRPPGTRPRSSPSHCCKRRFMATVQIGMLYLVAEFVVVTRRLRQSGLAWPAVRAATVLSAELVAAMVPAPAARPIERLGSNVMGDESDAHDRLAEHSGGTVRASNHLRRAAPVGVRRRRGNAASSAASNRDLGVARVAMAVVHRAHRRRRGRTAVVGDSSRLTAGSAEALAEESATRLRPPGATDRFSLCPQLQASPRRQASRSPKAGKALKGSEPATPDAGKDALRRGAWTEARAHLETSIAAGETAEALEDLGLAAWWLDDAALTFGARERSYTLYLDGGDVRGAARVAIWLVWDYLAFRGDFAVASGWLERARRLLIPHESCAGVRLASDSRGRSRALPRT